MSNKLALTALLSGVCALLLAACAPAHAAPTVSPTATIDRSGETAVSVAKYAICHGQYALDCADMQQVEDQVWDSVTECVDFYLPSVTSNFVVVMQNHGSDGWKDDAAYGYGTCADARKLFYHR